MTTISQLSRSVGDVLPKPRTPGETVGYAVLGVVLLLVIFAIVIKISRRDH